MMLRALLKKQLTELCAPLIIDRRKGTARTKGKLIAFSVLYVLLFLYLAAVFFGMSIALCEPLVELGAGWLYFAVVGLLALALGVLGSVFNTYAGLYNAKDNELLLSMPIPPWKILFARIAATGLLGLLYTALVLVPAIVARVMTGGFSAAGIVFSVLLILVMACLVTVLTCLLGWIVALIAARLKNKSYLTVLIALVFLGAYFYLYSQAYRIVGSIMENVGVIGDAVRTWIWPLYQFGLGAEGDAVGFLLFTLVTLALLALTCWILSRTFVRIVTSHRAEKRAVYKERAARTRGVRTALIGREFSRFTSSAAYMLNSGLGSVFLLVLAVLALWKREAVGEGIALIVEQIPELAGVMPLFGTVAVCLVASMNMITAPSVSLEGKTLWQLQSLPVDTRDVLRAKQALHILVTGVPAVLCAAAVAFMLGTDLATGCLMALCVFLFVCACAAFGLMLNLKMPNLTWMNETVPIKQSMPVGICLFAGWVVAPLMVGGYFLGISLWSVTFYLTVLCGAEAVVVVLLDLWLDRRGTKIFADL